MPTIDELRSASETTRLILKMRTVLIFAAVVRQGQPAPPMIEALTDESGQFLPLPLDYQRGAIGHIDKGAGIEFPREVSTQEAESHNSGSPTRKDTDTDVKSVTFTAQETKRSVLELALGIDLSNVLRGENGEVVIDHPDLPDELQVRLLVIGYDPKYRVAAGKFFPNFSPKDFPTVSWKRDEVLSYAIAGDALPDDELGTPVRDFPIAGPGAIEFRHLFGFAAAPVPWAADTAFVMTDRVTLAGGQVLEATEGGTSDASEPAAPAVGATVEDGTVTWVRVS